MAPPPAAAMMGIAARQMRKGASTFTHRQRPVGIRGLGHGAAGDDACIVDDDVEPAERVRRGARQAIGIGGIQQVARQMRSASIPDTSRSAAATRAPAARNLLTMTAPIPPDAPVTSACFPANSIFDSELQRFLTTAPRRTPSGTLFETWPHRACGQTATSTRPIGREQQARCSPPGYRPPRCRRCAPCAPRPEAS